jgi:aspartyl-tRNA(Asn)/glutamyl-tRNA(Gln) amidotransferase subunit C
MALTLGPDDARRIATLARIELTTDEVDLFARQLGDILNYVDELRALDTTGVEPTSHPLSAGPVWRADELVPSLDRETLLHGAPGASPRAGLFKVPKVL